MIAQEITFMNLSSGLWDALLVFSAILEIIEGRHHTSRLTNHGEIPGLAKKSFSHPSFGFPVIMFTFEYENFCTSKFWDGFVLSAAPT